MRILPGREGGPSPKARRSRPGHGLAHRRVAELVRGRVRGATGALALASLLACGGSAPQVDPAVAERPLPGPDTPIDSTLARAGGEIFQRRCVACHKLGGGDLVGPDLAGVTEVRDPTWLRGIVLEPDSMLREDPTARELLARYQVPMPDTELDEAGFRAVLEFLRAGGASP